MIKDIIGIIGGMGSYATLYMFKDILDSLPNIDDSKRPRIIIDNYCNIPNKIPACLSKDDREPFLSYLSASISNLINAGCTKIVIACSITHVLLCDMYAIHPHYKNYIIDMLTVVRKKMYEDGIKKACLFATKNALKSNVFNRYFFDLELISPLNSADQDEIFALMKAGKNNDVTEDMRVRFISLCNKYKDAPIILGCTELSMIFMCVERSIDFHIYDPLHETVKLLISSIL